LSGSEGAGGLDGLPAVTSFRDPDGVVFRLEERLLRLVKPAAARDVCGFLESSLGRRLAADGRLPRTTVVQPSDTQAHSYPAVRDWSAKLPEGVVLEHERIPFPSYPYEWPAEMLHSAAALTLELAEQSLGEGYGLKDATPYNVLFRGPDPVFVDVLSFEPREPGDPTWRPYAQFVRTFLLPLLVNKRLGLRLDQMLTTRRDGLEPEEVYRLLRSIDKIRPPFLSLVSIPKWLGRTVNEDDTGIYEKKLLRNTEKARFILEALLGGLRRTLRRAEPSTARSSTWSGYMHGGSNYSEAQLAAKSEFVSRAMVEFSPRRVLDVGCNTGHFSALAAESGASVVAIDYDPVVVGAVWRMARAKRLDILPLVVDLCRPTPPIGWLNRECASFLDRARGTFDVVLMLAVIHHMIVTERVPLERILDLAAELTRDLLVIEFIGPEDSMFRRLLRGREELHRDFTIQSFEAASRWLYLLRKTGKGTASAH
jgi:SAM-dependent methyltransferase